MSFRCLLVRADLRPIADVILLTNVCAAQSGSIDALISAAGHAASNQLYLSHFSRQTCGDVAPIPFCGSLEFWQEMVQRTPCLAASSVHVAAQIASSCSSSSNSVVNTVLVPLIQVDTSVYQASSQPPTPQPGSLDSSFISRCMADITVLQHLESKEQSQAVRNKMLGLSPNIVDATAVTAPRQRFLVVVAGVNNEKYIFQQVAQSLVEVWRP